MIYTIFMHDEIESSELLTGRFASIELKNEYDDIIKQGVSALYEMIKDYTRFLIVGIGNPHMTSDSLGAETAGRITAGENIAAIIPSVRGVTGIQSFDIVKGVAGQYKPDCIICIDALTARAYHRIGTVYQMTDTGITPGSGADNECPAFNKSSLGYPVIAIGVPTVVSARSIVQDSPNEFLVTPKNIDKIIKIAADNLAEIIAQAVGHNIS